jgi:hypothetical protein
MSVPDLHPGGRIRSWKAFHKRSGFGAVDSSKATFLVELQRPRIGIRL